MTGLVTSSTTKDLGWHGAWRFTREEVIEDSLVEGFQDLYEAAFGPLRTRSMARQVLDETEFRAQMVNPDVVKFVAWTAEDRPVGLCAVTRRLHLVPWISPDYFAARYPEHWQRDAVWYFSFILLHPGERHGGFLERMADVALAEPAAQHGVCAYDMCSFNDDHMMLGQRFAAAFHRTTGSEPEQTDAQNYYALQIR